MSLSHGADGEKFCLQTGAHHSPQQAHVTSLTQSLAQEVTAQPAAVLLSHSFTRQVTGRDLETQTQVKNASSGFKSRFHSDVVQCKRVKNPWYLHIYIHGYRKCLYRGEGVLPTGLGLLTQEMLQLRLLLSHSLSLQGVKSQPVTLKMKRQGG